MKAKIGAFFMILGVLLLAGAGGLLYCNYTEQAQAEASTDTLMPQLVDAIKQNQATAPSESVPAQTEPQETQPQEEDDVVVLPPKEETPVMTETEIDGYSYIGFVTLPSLGLDLPVMSDWSYAQLKISPCRYTGSIYTDDLVLMAHNYNRHFGQISELGIGDQVLFTDMNGKTVYYEVIATEILMPTAVEDITSGEYDLTLFTCTYGGQSRVTVRCDRIETQ